MIKKLLIIILINIFTYSYSQINYNCVIIGSEDELNLVVFDDGQSNSVGSAIMTFLDEKYKVPNEKTFIWDSTDFVNYVPGVNHRPVYLTTNNVLVNYRHGSVMVYVYLLRQIYPNANIYIVRQGMGSTSLYQYGGIDHNVNSVNELHYRLTYNLKTVKKWFADNNKTPTYLGYVWMQGEADAGNQTWANAYYSNFTEKVDSIRLIIPNMPIIPVLINYSATYVSTVNNAFISLFNNYENVDTVDNHPGRFTYKPDTLVHYSSFGHVQVAEALLPKLMKNINNR